MDTNEKLPVSRESRLFVKAFAAINGIAMRNAADKLIAIAREVVRPNQDVIVSQRRKKRPLARRQEPA